MDYVVGDSASALVTALTKAKNGKRTVLYIPESGVAAGFAGLEIKGRRLDFGIRALELAYTEPEKEKSLPLAGFRPGISDHKDYMPEVRDFIAGIAGGDIVQLKAPEIFYGGRKAECIFFSPDLSVLRTLFGAQEQQAIAREARELADNPPEGEFWPAIPDGGNCLPWGQEP